MNRVLVTGGAGFIGHHLVRALLARGLAVTVLDDLSVGRRENLPAAARLIVGDVRDRSAVRAALDGVDALLHQAAVVSIRASVEHFVRDAEVNLLGTLTLLRELAGRRIERAVLASSMAVYADSVRPDPLPESAPTAPQSPYGIAKLASEQYWLMMLAHVGIPATVLRYFNVYGPNQTPTPYVGVITIFIRCLLSRQAPIVFGDGEQRRDFIHVDDVVSANLAVLNAATADVAGRVFNVATGRATSVNDLAAGLTKILAPDIDPRHERSDVPELRNAIGDASALHRATGWSPSHQQLDLADVVEFWKARAQAGG